MPQDVQAAANNPGEQATGLSVLLVRLGAFWLALPTGICREVAEMRVLHTLPHRSARVPLSLVNIRGELQLCLRLGQFLGLESSRQAADQGSHTAYARLVVIEHEAERWVFLVEALAGVEHCSPGALPEETAALTPALRAVSSGCLNWRKTQVFCLDPERLCAALRREML